VIHSPRIHEDPCAVHRGVSVGGERRAQRPEGAPFDGGANSTLLADFRTKIGALGLPPDEISRLTAAASAALVESVKPAYEAIIAARTEQAERASTDDGVSRFRDGADHDATLLENHTTTELSADPIHELGLQQVARIHQEMAALMPPLHIRGTLPQFLVTMRDP
jgi:uncharacterized protein (DUF885 family)